MRTLILASAAVLIAQTSSATAQQKSVARADYMKTLNSHFALVDTNHDGSISKAELVAEQQKEMSQAKAAIAQQMRVRFNQLDTNKDGQLSFQEFLVAAPGLQTSENPDQLMQRLDANHDGKLNAQEFLAPQVAKFNKADANHDGIVTPEEAKAAAGK
jgi:Ca2+-binding EF-hand superfamily protein